MLTMLLCSLVSMTSCARRGTESDAGKTTTDDKRTILARPGQARRVAKDTPVKTWIKDASGQLTQINDVARQGEYIVADPGQRSASDAEVLQAPPAK